MNSVPVKLEIFFISTNQVWSGSEILWYESALEFIRSGHAVSFAVKYGHTKITAVQHQFKSFINYSHRYSKTTRFQKLVNKLIPAFKTKDLLRASLAQNRPGLVIISQGDNLASADIMELCIEMGINYISITQLVSEAHWLWLDGSLQKRLREGYEKSLQNYFVSKANLQLHLWMMPGVKDNNIVIGNPVILSIKDRINYPSTYNRYSIAFVGRIECFHKGLDILIQLLATEKWRLRPIEFNFYGEGPHSDIIKEQLVFFNISNVYLKGYAADVQEIWRHNQLLVLPSRMEGQSLALLEALYCGRAAIVTNVGGALEIIEDDITGFISANANLHDLDEAMERAWARRLDWEAMGKEAGNKVRGQYPENAIKNLNKKIEGIIKKSLPVN